MKAITVKQPWAWAIVHGGKNIENRSQVFSYRGPLLIHAGLADDQDGYGDERIKSAGIDTAPLYRHRLKRGHIIGVVDLVNCHRWSSDACAPCSAWANPHATHLVLKHPIALPHPVAARGVLGLWTPPEDVMAAVQAQLIRAVLR